MTPKQTEQFNRMRAVLFTIAKRYMTVPQIRRNAGSVGLSFEECLEAAYENVRSEAANAVRGVSELRPNGVLDGTTPHIQGLDGVNQGGAR